MKKFNLYFAILGLMTIAEVTAQVNSNAVISNSVEGSNVFLDASTNFNTSASSSASIGKGMVFPTTDLNAFRFDIDAADGITLPSYFNGMIVYNIGTGSTADPLLTTQTSGLVEGFYYFSNPTGEIDGNITSGVWKRLGGGSSVKSKEVTVVVPANPTTATLDLGTSVIAASEVNSFLGAKIYDSTGQNLVMTADSAYNKSTNLLTTGNGIMYQVLPAGTYKVVVDYK
jgi:hypothetical protein